MVISPKTTRALGSGFMTHALRITSQDVIAAWRLNPVLAGVFEELTSTGMNLPVIVDFPYDMKGPSGLAVPYFDGSVGLIDLYSTALNSNYTPSLFSVSLWAKVYEEAQWTNSTKEVIFRLGADANNFIEISKTTTTDQLQFEYKAGGTSDTVTYTMAYGLGETPLDWLHLVVTVDAANNSMLGYVKGIQAGSAASLGSWSGALDNDLCLVAGSAVTVPSAQFKGYVSDLIIYGAVLTPREVLNVSRIV